jgi:hypothetical protein
MSKINKTPSEMLADINSALCAIWKIHDFRSVPSKLVVSRDIYDYCAANEARNGVSLLAYIKENSIVPVDLVVDGE